MCLIQLQIYSNAIADKGAALQNCFGFVDGSPSFWLFAKFSCFKIVVRFNIVQRLETKEYQTFISKAKHKFSP